ncbi:MAG: Maf family protein, partial [Nitrospiraceae bacterium]
MRLILASTSPRRKELLALLGYPFDVVPPAFAECLTPGQPADTQAKEFAFQKAASCAAREPDAMVLGSDTVIALDEEVIGKTRDLHDAEMILRRLMGRPHVIYTAEPLNERGHAEEEVTVQKY